MVCLWRATIFLSYTERAVARSIIQDRVAERYAAAGNTVEVGISYKQGRVPDEIA